MSTATRLHPSNPTRQVDGALPAHLGGGLQFGLDLGDEPAVARQTKEMIDPIVLAPRHQGFPREAGIGTQEDPHLWPAPAGLGNNARYLRDRAGAAVDVGRAQLGRQQMPAAEDVERQVAVAVVIAVKEALLLMPVQWVVSGVEIEDDLLRRRGVRLEEEVDEQAFDLRPVIADLVIASWLRPAQLQPVERALARHRCAVRAPRGQ